MRGEVRVYEVYVRVSVLACLYAAVGVRACVVAEDRTGVVVA